MKKKMKVSRYLHFLPVDKEMYIGWNRFFPSIFILNKSALELLDRIKKDKPIEANEEMERFFEELKKYRFLYEGDGNDPYKENFLNIVQQNIHELDCRAKDFYQLEEDYSELRLVNEECNLNCSYCVNHYGFPAPPAHTRVKKKLADKLRIINKCVDQFFSRKIKKGLQDAEISFNGGEILVDWPLVKKILQQISKKYPGINIKYQINTNLALLTEEMARFFKRHHFKVHISIDGYREAHNKTRKYHNGKGSFDDIIKKVERYRKINKKDSLVTFQGTIEYPDEFRPEEVYKMDKYGFVSARLAPNLLNVSEEDAKKKAILMGKFLELNSRYPFQVTELIFTKAKDKINQQEYQFSFNCRGLSGFHKLGIEINLSTLAASHLCGFIQQAALPMEKLRGDIYNPELWQVSYQFIKERMETVLKNCMECPLIGICVGGCILSGIDSRNRLNKAACVYQKEMWNIYVKKAYQDRKKKKEKVNC
ncbi:MAG: radical SAM protein [Candidatus Aminicenantes bacterium]|nr:MAG: radical SAM protein [Candidatus Aminicenantes bacterium]